MTDTTTKLNGPHSDVALAAYQGHVRSRGATAWPTYPNGLASGFGLLAIPTNRKWFITSFCGQSEFTWPAVEELPAYVDAGPWHRSPYGGGTIDFLLWGQGDRKILQEFHRDSRRNGQWFLIVRAIGDWGEIVSPLCHHVYAKDGVDVVYMSQKKEEALAFLLTLADGDPVAEAAVANFDHLYAPMEGPLPIDCPNGPAG